jgi:hypothetical protein
MAANSSTDPGPLGRIRLPNACIITEISVVCSGTPAGTAAWTRGSGARLTTFSIYPEGQLQQAITLTYGDTSVATIASPGPGLVSVSTDQVINSGVWLVVTAWDGATGGSGFNNADIYVVYRENDVRIMTSFIAQTTGTNL